MGGVIFAPHLFFLFWFLTSCSVRRVNSDEGQGGKCEMSLVLGVSECVCVRACVYMSELCSVI